MEIINRDNNDIWIRVSSGHVTVISNEDEWIIETFPCWNITGSRSKYIFVERSFKTEYSTVRERVYLHRVIMRLTGPENVDHIDRDRLNNRRSNLRVCSMRQNMANIAARAGKRFKGVHKDKTRTLKKPYAAYIDARNAGLGKREYLGRFETEEEAARAYDKRAKELYGDFAFQNIKDQ